MTAVDHAELKRLADELVQMLAPDQGESAHPAFGHAVRIQNAHAALLSEIEGLKAERDEGDVLIDVARILEDHVDYDDENSEHVVGLNRRHAALSAAEAIAPYLRTQAPDSWRPDRAALARVLKAWCEGGLLQDYASVADAILALRPQTAESGK